MATFATFSQTGCKTQVANFVFVPLVPSYYVGRDIDLARAKISVSRLVQGYCELAGKTTDHEEVWEVYLMCNTTAGLIMFFVAFRSEPLRRVTPALVFIIFILFSIKLRKASIVGLIFYDIKILYYSFRLFLLIFVLPW